MKIRPQQYLRWLIAAALGIPALHTHAFADTASSQTTGNAKKLVVDLANAEIDVIKGVRDSYTVEGEETSHVRIDRDGDTLKILSSQGSGSSVVVTGSKPATVYSSNSLVVVNGVVVSQGANDRAATTPVKIRVTASDVQDVVLLSAKSVRLTGLDAERLSLAVVGQGDIWASGKVRYLNASITGQGAIHALKLSAKTVDASLSGMGSIDTYASDTLDARLSGMGNINVAGNPKSRHTKMTGMGHIQDVQ
ncbi:GIN domain-containing protein [Achromobacter anxifer]|uniref:GIN domain-containing protein n=1 Tax=Achromobacter anxifer TaxID=1287737 RepID=UPI0023F94A8F|nr:DUF2807 domain-containing protein [Achromobacter anxifer]MDF8364704.1 DUF2807 domain-containing protein [Achromobacter anxifer]